MRILLAFCICFHLAECSAQPGEAVVFLGSRRPAPQQPVPQQPVPQQPVPQQPVPQQIVPQLPAPQRTAPQRTAPPGPQQGAPQQGAPQQGAPQQAAPQADPFMDEPAPSQPDNLDLDQNQAFNFNESNNALFRNSADSQSSIASNSNFRGASPQMIGDFGGGSTMKFIGGTYPVPTTYGDSNIITAPLALAGGSRRIKIAENNQVMPEDRIYGTVNYFHNAYQAIGSGPILGGPVTVVDSENLAQYTVGFEKVFCIWESPFSIDVRMPFTGGVNQIVPNGDIQTNDNASLFTQQTGSMGNLSTILKAYLLEVKGTSISGGLGISLPTGSPTSSSSALHVPDGLGNPVPSIIGLSVLNNAVHLMPFLGAYRQVGNSCWLQAFTQIDVPTCGNNAELTQLEAFNGTDYVLTGVNDFRLKEQSLLYADISFGKWLYRNVHDCGRPECTNRERGLTGIASVLELHYTGSLNDADPYISQGVTNRFNVVNLTAGLQVELNEQWRINLAGAFPLRDRSLGAGGRDENRFFDSEFALQINRFF